MQKLNAGKAAHITLLQQTFDKSYNWTDTVRCYGLNIVLTYFRDQREKDHIYCLEYL